MFFSPPPAESFGSPAVKNGISFPAVVLNRHLITETKKHTATPLFLFRFLY